MTASTNRPDYSSIATRLRGGITVKNLECQRFAGVATRKIGEGQLPLVRVTVLGLDGLSVRLIIDGVPGAIAHARTRRQAREIARASVAATLRLSTYAFDLEVDGA